MRAVTKRTGSGVKSGKQIKRSVAEVAWRMVELLEDRQMLSTYFVNMTAGGASTSPHTVVDVPGYMTDIGSGYGDRADRGNPGVTYGWVTPGTDTPTNNEPNGRNRDTLAQHPTAPYSPLPELYDSFNHMQKASNPGPANWEIAVPNGQYIVHVASGDPTSNTVNDSHHVILAEGTLVYDYNEIAGGGNNAFAEGTVLTTVSDGTLTISAGTGSANSKLSFVEATTYTGAPPTVAPAITVTQSGASAQISWFGVPQATSYNVYRGTASGGETLLKSGLNATGYLDTTASTTVPNFYYVVPVNPAGVGAASTNSNEVSITITQPTQAPVVTVGQTGGSASLTWPATPKATSYNIFKSSTQGGETLLQSGVTALNFVDPNAGAGPTYYWVVPANVLGTGPHSNEVTYIAKPPTATPVLTGSQVNGNVSLTWPAVALAGFYNIYRGNSAGNENPVPIATNVVGTSYTDTTMTSPTDFYYIIPASPGGVGPKSNEVGISFSPPQGFPTLSVVPASGKVSLTWTADLFASKVNIFRGTAFGNETLYKSGVSGTSYDDTGITIGNTYYYYVVPTNPAGDGGASNEVFTDTHAAYAHVNFQTPSTTTPTGYLPDVGLAYADRGNTFSYGWWNSPNATTVAVPAADTAVRERGSTVSPDKRYDTLDHFHNTTSGSLPGNNFWEIALPNGIYQVRVVAGDPSNSDSFYSLFAEATKDPTTNQPLNDGSGVQLMAQAPGTVGISHFVDSGFVTVEVTDGNLTISEGPGASNGKIDFIDIDTKNVVSVPADPSASSITNVHASNLTLNWTDNSTNETGFRIEQSTDGTNFAPIATIPAHTGTGSMSFVVPGLTPQTNYYYRVFANNLQGDSANPTSIVNTTTAATTGGVSGRINPTSGTINLTTEGALDWAHWGQTNANTFDHKAGVTSLISDATGITGSAKQQLTGSPTTFSWTDGAAVGNVTANSAANELATFAYGHGFSFTVPADTTARVLRVYVGVVNVRGQLVARLSDGSAPDYVDSSLFNAASGDGVYTIAYSAASAGQTLTVTWIEIPPDGDQVAGHLALKAATLQVAPSGIPAGNTTLTATALSSGRIGLSWNVVPNASGYVIERASDNGGSPGSFATLATLDSTKGAYLDASTNSPGSKFYYRVTPYNLLSQNGSVSNVSSAIAATGPFGDGALATYFTYNGAPATVNDPPIGTIWPTTSIDPTINFDWGAGAPPGAGAGFQTDNFMTRWTFKLKPEFSETYTFFADVDDGMKLIINGQTIINNLSRRAALGTKVASTPITLVAGQTYDVVFEQIEQGGSAGAKLYWQSPSLPQEIIPASVMFHVAPVTTIPPKITGIEVDGPIPAGFTYTPDQHLIVRFNQAVGANENFLNVMINSPDFLTTYAGGQVSMTFDEASNSALITIPGVPNAFPDNNYLITIDSIGISDYGGNQLDGNGDGTAGDGFNGSFYVLTGDTQVSAKGTPNRDRKVDFIDFQRLELGFGKVAADRPSASDGDLNHDGVIDRLDLQIFNQQIGKTLAPPAPAAVPAAPVPSAPVSSSAPAPVGVTSKPVVSNAGKPVVTAKPVVTKPIVAAKPIVPAKLVALKKVAAIAKPLPPAPPKPAAFSIKRVRDLLN